MAKMNNEQILKEITEAFEIYKPELQKEINATDLLPAKLLSSVTDGFADQTTSTCACPSCGITIKYSGYRYSLLCPSCGAIIKNIVQEGSFKGNSYIAFFKAQNFDVVADIYVSRTYEFNSNNMPTVTEWKFTLGNCAALGPGMKTVFRYNGQKHSRTTSMLRSLFAYHGVNAALQNGLKEIAGVPIDINNMYTTFTKLGSACQPKQAPVKKKTVNTPVFNIYHAEAADITDVVITVEQCDNISKTANIQAWCTECGHIWTTQQKEMLYDDGSMVTNGYKFKCPACGKELFSSKYGALYKKFVTVEEKPEFIDVVYSGASLDSKWNIKTEPYLAVRLNKKTKKVSKFIYDHRANIWNTTSVKIIMSPTDVVKYLSAGIEKTHLENLVEHRPQMSTVITYLSAYLDNPVLGDVINVSKNAAASVYNYFENGKGEINTDGKTPEEILGKNSQMLSWADTPSKRQVFSELSKTGAELTIPFLNYIEDNKIDPAFVNMILRFGFSAEEITVYLSRVEKYQCLKPSVAAKLWCEYIECCACSKTELKESWERFPRYLHTEFDKAFYKARMTLGDSNDDIPIEDIYAYAYSKWNYRDEKTDIEVKAVNEKEYLDACRIIGFNTYFYRRDKENYIKVVIYAGKTVVGIAGIDARNNDIVYKNGFNGKVIQSKYMKHLDAYICNIGKA